MLQEHAAKVVKLLRLRLRMRGYAKNVENISRVIETMYYNVNIVKTTTA